MGLLFAPITTIAIMEIPNRKMAQASGLINVIRQIGGSFGVATFGTLLTNRTIYHSAIYGQQLNAGSDTFKETMMHLQNHATQAVGGTVGQSLTSSKVMLFSFVQKQAFIAGVDDVFYIAGVLILISVLPVIILRVHKRRKGAPGAPSME